MKDKKKGFFAKLFEKIDQNLEDKSKKSCCCCCEGKKDKKC